MRAISLHFVDIRIGSNHRRLELIEILRWLVGLRLLVGGSCCGRLRRLIWKSMFTIR